MAGGRKGYHDGFAGCCRLARALGVRISGESLWSHFQQSIRINRDRGMRSLSQSQNRVDG